MQMHQTDLTLSHRQKRDVFVAKINSQGEWKWAKRARSSGTDKRYQMSVDANKQVFLGGTMKGEATFSSNLVVGPQIPNDTSASAWVAQLDGSTNTGDWVWAKWEDVIQMMMIELMMCVLMDLVMFML